MRVYIQFRTEVVAETTAPLSAIFDALNLQQWVAFPIRLQSGRRYRATVFCRDDVLCAWEQPNAMAPPWSRP